MGTEEREIEALIELADLKGHLNYDIVKFGSLVEIKLFSDKNYCCLPREVAHKVLEECVLSTNREDYFWYLAEKATRRNL